MDKIDQKLLAELDINLKIPLSILARKIRISQQHADYRIKRLIKEGFITKFGTIINLKSLGLEHYRIFFNFNYNSKYSNKEILEFLKNQKGVYWAARTGGKFDLHIVLFVRDFEEFDNFIDYFNQTFPNLINDYKACYVLEHEILKHKFFSKNYQIIKYGYNEKLEKIDELDKKILNEIKDNCRLSALEISKDKQTSYKTIINRIKNLEKRKIILGYRIFIKSKEKNPYLILISFRNYNKLEEKKLLSYLESNNLTTQFLRMFGQWQLYIHARAENPEKIQEMIIEIKNKYQIIESFEIIPIFEDISINLYPV